MVNREKIKEDIRNLLLSKGFNESAYSGRILHHPNIELEIKYRFGKNNFQKFRHGIKVFSIPFSRLEIKDGKISKKIEKFNF